ncbi:MAG: tetratricopeptide repeat protein [Desulfobacteraceae bacterium]
MFGGGDLVTTGDVRRKLTAIFSADVEGYSRLMEEDELATVETLTSHKEIMGKLIRRYRGRVVDSTGDNLLAEFGSVVDAVQCAVEVQQVLNSKNETLPEKRRMYFRIGINSGDVIEEGELIYGDGVNVAARVESLAEGGGISISGTAYDQLGKKLPLGYEYLGEQTVKNIEKPVRVYRVLTKAEAAGKVIGEERPRPKQLRGVAIGALAVLIIVAAGLAIWNFYFRPAFEPASVEKMAFPLPDKPSIAVLPFTNMSGDPEQEYIGDGLSENIISALSKVSNMLVIARNSTFSYKGKAVKIQQVAEELGVQYVLEGSVQKSGDRLRVTAQLIDALSGHHLWSEKYDREMRELFDLQDEITKKIVVSLEVELGLGERARIMAKSTNNLEAWSYVIRSFDLFFKANKEDSAKGKELLENAVRLDPGYSVAWAWLYLFHTMDARLGLSESPVDSRKRAQECLQKALALDDENSIAHSFLGFSYLLKGQHDKAVSEGKLAISLEPNSTGGLAIFSCILHHSGRFEEAIEQMKKAMRLGAIYPAYYEFKFALNYAFLGRYDEAIAAFNQLEERCRKGEFPTRAIGLAETGLAVVYVELGRLEEARALVAEALKANPDLSLKHLKGPPYKDPVYLQRLLESLRKAGLPETPPLPLPDKPSIAVLPFVNMSGDPEQEYFSDGISEEIITALCKTPKLFVIARTSSFKYKGKEVDVRTVGRELGVHYVLEGSVRKSEDRLRITAQLVDAKTGNHLWAERYDRDLKDIFAMQDEITMKIITELQVKLTSGEQARLKAKGTKNLQAYLKYLQASESFLRMNRENNLKARQMAEEAIALDPGYAPSYIILARTHNMDVYLRSSQSPRQSLELAFDLAQKVLTMDESSSDAHSLLAAIYLLRRQHEEALAEAEKALTLSPNSADRHNGLGRILYYTGRPEEAIPLLERGLRLSPVPDCFSLYTLGVAYIMAGRYEDATETCRRAVQAEPQNLWAHVVLAASYSLSEREDEARDEVAEVLKIQPNFSLEHVARLPFKEKEDLELFVGAQRKAGLK